MEQIYDLSKQMSDILTQKGWTISTAESLTGGKLGGYLSEVSGASRYYRGCICAYDLLTKINILKVDQQEALATNCVSMLVAMQMSVGGRKLFNTDICIATTGYAESFEVHKPHAYVCINVHDFKILFIVKPTSINRVDIQNEICKEILTICLEELQVEE